MRDIHSPAGLDRARARGGVFSRALLLLLATGCGDPEPGEGMAKSMAEKTLPEIVSASTAIQSPDIPKIDPGTLDEAEIEKVIPPGPRCEFSYTADSPPVVAAGIGADAAIQGVIKIHGRLVRMKAGDMKNFESLVSGGTFIADEVEFAVKPEMKAGEARGGDRRWPAEALFTIRDEHSVGYYGWYACKER